MTEIREVLRLWLREMGLRSVAELVALDRKTVHRYTNAAVAAGLSGPAGKSRPMS